MRSRLRTTCALDLGNGHRELVEGPSRDRGGLEDLPRRYQALQKHGIRNEQHFISPGDRDRFIAGVRLENAQAAGAEAFHSVLRDYSIESQQQSDACARPRIATRRSRSSAEPFGWDMGNIVQMQMNALTSVYMDQHKQRATGELAGELGPVEGVALKTWAAAQAALAGGKLSR